MPDTFVLFVDILGFAALVEAAPAAVEQLRHELFHSQSTVVSTDQAPAPPDVLLIRRFSAFHLHLQERLTELQGGDVTSIIFSDSAFIQSNSAEDITRLSIGLMTLGGHPKPAISGQPEIRPFRVAARGVDADGERSVPTRHEQRLG